MDKEGDASAWPKELQTVYLPWTSSVIEYVYSYLFVCERKNAELGLDNGGFIRYGQLNWLEKHHHKSFRHMYHRGSKQCSCCANIAIAYDQTSFGKKQYCEFHLLIQFDYYLYLLSNPNFKTVDEAYFLMRGGDGSAFKAVTVWWWKRIVFLVDMEEVDTENY